MDSADPYEVLGVDRNATAETIHRAFRDYARAAHPDLARDGGDRMASLNEAWFVLRDPDRRAAFDLRMTQPLSSVPSVRDPTFGRRAQLLLRVIVVVSALLCVTVLFLVFLVGFGRVGG